MTLANAMALVAHYFPGAPLMSMAWDTPDHSMPYRVLLGYLGMLPAVMARGRIEQLRLEVMARGGDGAQAMAEDDADMAFPA